MAGKDDKRFAITWKIKNFSYCFYGERQTIDSPEFYAENVRRTKWILKISQEDALLSHFTVLIKRAEEDYGPASVKLYLKICLISNKGFSLRRESIVNTEFSKGTAKGFQKLLERAALFATTKRRIPPSRHLNRPLTKVELWKIRLSLRRARTSNFAMRASSDEVGPDGQRNLVFACRTLTLHCELIIVTGVVSQLIKDSLLRTEDLNFEAECSSSSALDDFRNVYNDDFP
ncbi:hypothetical protein CDAR_173761 [Caerostris darwini]|uniref:MATH domain-containing protein n=1 Tax=Caerostris darwini TaxID=1538125 RepID=A0AAV4VG35_9ARAC|nr:hypothetical protein CDAR_173761 [Caerostris darwini]